MHLRNLCHGVKSKQRLPFAITIILKINEYLTIDSVVCRKSFVCLFFFYWPLFEPANRRLQQTRTFDHIFIPFASQCGTFFSIQSKTLMFDAVSPSNSPFWTVDFHMTNSTIEI